MKTNDASKLDGYITINSKEKEENIELISNKIIQVSNTKSLSDTLKPIIEQNQKISEIYIKKILNEQNKIQTMIEPLTKFTQEIIEIYNPIIKNITENITKIFNQIDFSKIDLIYKEIAIIYLSNGFYPYKNTNIKFDELLSSNNKTQQTKIIKKGIKLDIPNKKRKLITVYPQYKKEINEIYALYKNQNYRLCILSLLNIISIINNAQLEHLDFTQKDEVRNKLLEKQIMKEKETNYLLFSQYIEDNELKKSNKLLLNYKSKPEKYNKIPYNRNAILHGHSQNFGTNENCLRWFSVLFNTLEISEKFNEIENQTNNH